MAAALGGVSICQIPQEVRRTETYVYSCVYLGVCVCVLCLCILFVNCTQY